MRVAAILNRFGKAYGTRGIRSNGAATKCTSLPWFIESPRLPYTYSAASASCCPGNSPAYLVIPTMVNTLVKCGDSP